MFIYLFCPGAKGFADLVPKTFLACPGGIGLSAERFEGCGGLGGRGGAAHSIKLKEKTTIAR
ncbi:MAG: hypothetical protein J0I88_10965 [Chryseobacterium sp.]|nr:hypothetical protein [Chryseobacterium sp.]OJX31695.1 MAG: hypothetical protein BGO86_07325 [Chryseobacterium sp. 36-9]